MSDPKLNGMFVHFDDMTWPACGSLIADLGWKCRYDPASLTRDEELVLAAIVDAYTQMVNDPQQKRNRVCSGIKRAINDAKELTC